MGSRRETGNELSYLCFFTFGAEFEVNVPPEIDDDPWAMRDAGGIYPTLEQPLLYIDTIEGVEPLDAQIGISPKITVPDALYGALFDQPDLSAENGGATCKVIAVPPLQTYAILDAAKVTNLPELLECSDLEHRCLFKGNAYDEMHNVAPWIVRLEESNSFTRSLFTRSDAPWHLWDQKPGVFFRSRRTLDELQRHFRKFTKVRDENDKWLYLRWWETSFWHLAASGYIGAVQQNLIAPIDVLVVPLEVPIFGDRWLLLHPEKKSVVGENRLDAAAMRDIRLTTNLYDCLLVLDGFARSRFKGLGFEQTTRFVRHALASAERFGLQYRDQTAYLMFLMNFLGSWFWFDPRFRKLAAILQSSELSSHRKIDELHTAFSRLAANFIGDDYGLYWSAIGKAEDKLPPMFESSASDEAILRVQVECHDRPEVLRMFPVAAFLERSRQAAEALEMNSSNGYQASVVLSYWFGTDYHRDPLFPWIKEKTAGHQSADARARAVIDYALKRMRKTRTMSGRDVL